MELLGVGLFAGLDRGTLERLAAGAVRRRFAAGEVLCREGEPCTTLFAITSGLASVSMAGVQVSLMRRGDVAGELGLFSGQPRTAMVEAVVTTEVLELDRLVVADLFASHPELLENLEGVFRRRLIGANRRLVDRGRGEATLVIAGPSAGALLSQAFGCARQAVPRDVLTVQLGPGPLPASLQFPDPDELLGRLDDLLDGHAFVLAAAWGCADTSALAQVAAVADRIVAVGEPEESDRAIAGLGAAAVRAERVDLLGNALGRHGRLATTGRSAAGPWLARHLTRSKLGLALGAGGAKGYAHVAVLAALEQAGYTIDAVGGTSLGALIAARIAMREPSAAIRELLDEAFNEETVRQIFSLGLSGTSAGKDDMRAICERFGGGLTAAELNIPLVVMCADLDNRAPAPIADGPVGSALVATTSLAGFFPPYEQDGRRLVDGVALIPVPVDAVREAGADLVIGVNLMSRQTLPAWPGTEPPGRPAGRQRALETLLEVMDLMQLDASTSHATRADVVITPQFGPCTWRDFGLADRFLDAGTEAALPAIQRLRQLASPVTPDSLDQLGGLFMATQFTLADLREILTGRIGVDEADIPDDPDTTFDDIGLDSLAIMELQLEVEQRYGLRVPEEDAEKISSFREAVDYINGKLAERG